MERNQENYVKESIAMVYSAHFKRPNLHPPFPFSFSCSPLAENNLSISDWHEIR